MDQGQAGPQQDRQPFPNVPHSPKRAGPELLRTGAPFVRLQKRSIAPSPFSPARISAQALLPVAKQGDLIVGHNDGV